MLRGVQRGRPEPLGRDRPHRLVGSEHQIGRLRAEDALLLGTEFTFMTGVDLALIGVILFLLTMLNLRTLWGLEARSRVRLLRSLMRRRHDTPD